MKILIFTIIALITFSTAEKARYDNYRVYRVDIENNEQLKVLHYLADNSDSVNMKNNLVIT